MSLGSNEGGFPHIPTNKLKINLIESTIILHGSPEDSLGCFMRGELILNLTKPTKIKKIELTFLGKIKLFLPRSEGEITSSSNYEEREIISHTWTFLNNPQYYNEVPIQSNHHNNKSLASKLLHSISLKKSSDSNRLSKYHVLKKGTHSFPFELFLPGTLPESINTNIGRITYKLSARVLKSGIFSKLKKSQLVTILRTITDEWNQGKVVSNDWKNLCRYEISFHKKAFPIGDCVRVDLKLIPKDVNKVSLQFVHIDLVEKSTYNLSPTLNSSSQELIVCGIKLNDFIKEWIDKDSNDDYLIKLDKNSSQQQQQKDDVIIQDETLDPLDPTIDSRDLCYHETISFRIPSSPYLVHPTYASDPITISHDLKFLFCLKVQNYNFTNQTKYKKFTLIIPITIIASKCKDDVLPIYDDDDGSTISKASWDEISWDDVSLPPSYESSIAGSQNNSTVSLGVYN